MVTQTTCGHFNHLFAHPFCSSQPLFKRATNIAVLCMIGVVAAIVASKIFKRPLISLFGYQYPRAEKPFAIPSGLCAEAQKAMEFAEKALKENPNAKSTLSRTTFQPSKPIAQLVDLYWSTFNKHYVEALKSNLDAPYDSEDMLKAADEYLKIAYAISLLTLEDHEDFCESITERSKKQYFTYR
ncbi:MAG: hypothetical protein KDK50_00005, partial [Chlamydiia bacterium]|nr:hypothetical protein [Chlamydiia bacterium]